MMEPQAVEDAKPFAQAREKYSELEGVLATPTSMTHSEVEHLLDVKGRELLRCLFQGHLDLRSMREDRATTVVGSDGEERTHRRKRSRSMLALLPGARPGAGCPLGVQRPRPCQLDAARC
jgi:hypothetical protein